MEMLPVIPVSTLLVHEMLSQQEIKVCLDFGSCVYAAW